MKFRKTAEEKAQAKAEKEGKKEYEARAKAKKNVEKLLNEVNNYYNIYLNNYLGKGDPDDIYKTGKDLFDRYNRVLDLLKTETVVPEDRIKSLKTGFNNFKNEIPKHIQVAINAKMARIKLDGVVRKLKGRVSLKEMKKAVTTKNKK